MYEELQGIFPPIFTRMMEEVLEGMYCQSCLQTIDKSFESEAHLVTHDLRSVDACSRVSWSEHVLGYHFCTLLFDQPKDGLTYPCCALLFRCR